MINELWRDYIATLERLQQTVQEQSSYLKQNDWQSLGVFYGRKENIKHHITSLWNQLKSFYKTQKNVLKNDKERFSLEKAQKLILDITSLEEINRQLLQNKMKKIEEEKTKLNVVKKQVGKYLTSETAYKSKGMNWTL